MAVMLVGESVVRDTMQMQTRIDFFMTVTLVIEPAARAAWVADCCIMTALFVSEVSVIDAMQQETPVLFHGGYAWIAYR